MSEINFDAQSERELAALEDGPVGDLLLSTGRGINPQADFAASLEARLRAIPSNGVRHARTQPTLRQSSGWLGDTPRSSAGRGRVLRLASVGLGLAATLVMAFWLAGMFSSGSGGRGVGGSNPQAVSGTASPTATQGDEFVPAGKVRHIVLVGMQIITATTATTSTSIIPAEVTREEFWLAPGTDHYLQRSYAPVWTGWPLWTLVDETYYYIYNSQGDGGVDKYPFDPKYEAAVVPDPALISQVSAMLGARSLGETTWNGRHVILIEVSNGQATNYGSEAASGNTPVPVATGNVPNVAQTANTQLIRRYWIDLQTNQLAQVETITSTGDGGLTSMFNYIESDELVDRSSLPADYFTVAGLPDPPVRPDGLQGGDKAPAFELWDVRTGQTVTLSSLLGKPVVLVFWGTWCPPCKQVLPDVQDLHLILGDAVQFIGISMGPRDDPAVVKEYVDANSYTWMFVHDDDYSVATRYMVSSIPSYYFIDARGIVQKIEVGRIVSQERIWDDLGAIDADLKLMNPPGMPATDRPGWYTFTSLRGSFSVLMPAQNVEPSGRDGWQFFGARQGQALTYINGYKDFDLEAQGKSESDFLDAIVPDAETFMNGKARAERKTVMLGTHPGFELVLDRTDGRFMRARVYSVGSRVYLVYVIAQDEAALYTGEMNSYLDSLMLLTD